MALGRQLAVYYLDVAVITVAGFVRLASIAAVAYGSYRDIAYLKGGLWTCRSLSAYKAARHWTGPRLEQEKATASPRRCNLWQPLGSEDLSSDKHRYCLENPDGLLASFPGNISLGAKLV